MQSRDRVLCASALLLGCYASSATTGDAALSDAALADTAQGDAAIDVARSRDASVRPSDVGSTSDATASGTECPPHYAVERDCTDGEPHWEPQDGLWPSCAMEIARCPANAVRFSWEPCADGPPSCRRATLDSFGVLWTPRSSGGGHDGTRGVAVLDGTLDSSRAIAFVSTEGMALAIWRYPEDGSCVVLRGAASARAGGFIVMPLGEPRDTFSRLFHAPVDRLARIEGPVSSSYDPLHLSVTDDFAAISSVQVLDVVGACTPYQRFGEPWASQYVVDLSAFGRTLLWSMHEAPTDHAWFDRAWLRSGGPGRVPADYYVPEPGFGATAMVTDGVDVAWVQVRDLGRTWGEHELWTAPYVEDGADLRPRRVLTLAHAPADGAGIGGGFYVYAGSGTGEARPTDTLFVVQLATGAVGTLPGGYSQAPVYVTEREILIQRGDRLVRFDPRELFAPP